MPSSASLFSIAPAIVPSSRCGLPGPVRLILGRLQFGTQAGRLRAVGPPPMFSAGESEAFMHHPKLSRLLLPTCFALLAGLLPAQAAESAADGIVLAPHRAVYDLKLTDSRGKQS